MTVAAAYARFSSQNQRDESIEIQLREIGKVVEREGWVMGEAYTDYALSGRTDDRPAFQRCIADGEERRYDVLVIYKLDRLARNVAVAQETKTRLFKAGVRIWSVREGEILDTPEGFLTSAMQDIMADYYSRNLSVLVRSGFDQSARERKAAGHRLYGYYVDEDDHFQIDEDQASYVREMFAQFLQGKTMGEIAQWLTDAGARTRTGHKWTPQALAQTMKNPAYKGTYRLSGHVVENGMPAIVSEADFERVQAMRAMKQKGRRRRNQNLYLLTDRSYCLCCGGHVCGTSGTSRSGKKHTYYGCALKGGCGMRMPSEVVEETFTEIVTEFISDDASVEALVGDVMDFAATRPSHVDEYQGEISRLQKESDKLVESIAQGVPAERVASAISARDSRISELEGLLAREQAHDVAMPSEEEVRDLIKSTLDRAGDASYKQVLAQSIVHRIYFDKECMVVVLNFGTPAKEYTLEELQELTKMRTPSSEGVRIKYSWLEH